MTNKVKYFNTDTIPAKETSYMWIKGYEGSYLLSNTGRVIKVRMEVVTGKTIMKILKPYKNKKTGSKTIQLYKGQLPKLFYINTLLSTHFNLNTK